MKLLITCGAGYIASHVAKELLETTGYSIFILDNLSRWTGDSSALASNNTK